MYWEDIKSGKRIIKSIVNIRKQILDDMKEHKVKKVGAYNMGFDKKALNNTGKQRLNKIKIRFCPFIFFS